MEGTEELAAALRQAGERAPAAFAGVLYREAERIMAKSKEIVPVDTGALKGTGHVQLPEVNGPEISVTLGFGGPAVDYAVIVHEDTMLRHTPGQQAKYLEQPMLEAARDMEARLAAELRREIEGR